MPILASGPLHMPSCVRFAREAFPDHRSSTAPSPALPASYPASFPYGTRHQLIYWAFICRPFSVYEFKNNVCSVRLPYPQTSCTAGSLLVFIKHVNKYPDAGIITFHFRQ